MGAYTLSCKFISCARSCGSVQTSAIQDAGDHEAVKVWVRVSSKLQAFILCHNVHPDNPISIGKAPLAQSYDARVPP